MKSEKQIKKSTLLMIVVSVVVLVFTTSFAMFTYSRLGLKSQKLDTGTLILNLKEDKPLSLIDAYPISDGTALKKEAYSFTIENTGTEEAKYRVLLEDDEESYISDNCGDKKMPWDKIKYSIKRDSSVSKIAELGSNPIIDTHTLKVGETSSYEVRLWINSSAGSDVSGLHFHGKILVQAILSNRTDYETGA